MIAPYVAHGSTYCKEGEEMATEKWIPKVGDHVFSVCEFILSDYERNKKIPGHDRHGFEIVESVVKGRTAGIMQGWEWNRCRAREC